MRKLVILIFLMFFIVRPVFADEFTAPTAPDAAKELLPVETKSFSEDLWMIIQEAISRMHPELMAAAGLCTGLFAIIIVVSVIQSMPGNTANMVRIVATLTVATLLMQQTGSLIRSAAETVQELSEYGKLLLPVMAAATAAQGGIRTSTAVYAGTAIFNTLLCSAIKLLLIPMIYIFLVLSIVSSAIGENTLDKLRDFVKWLSTWLLKIVLYIFTGYITITGVVSGTADAASLKAAKLTMSGMIPVVGGILSDASEAVLVGAGVMKSSVGIYGVLTLIALWIAPFLKIGVRYVLLKMTAAFSQLFCSKEISELIASFSDAMALLLGMTGSVSVMLLISTVCFMKGVG